jgi:hypothetical protein
MEKKDYLAKIEDLTAEQIVEGISGGIVTLEELRNTGDFGADKQKAVKTLLKKRDDDAKTLLKKRDDDAFAAANTVEELKKYLSVFPDGNHATEAKEKIRKRQDEDTAKVRNEEEHDRIILKIRNDINEYALDELTETSTGKFKENLKKDLYDLCQELGLDAEFVQKYEPPKLPENDIPKNASDIPAGYTDVFFWGIPSSGKTCALSAIFSTIKKKYTMETPDCAKKFGATYRDSLTNIFRKNGYGYLPTRTNEDRTQYMPFLLYKHGEKETRKISFFELSGEVFKYFYEHANNIQIVRNDEKARENVEKSFQTLKLLLDSNNQKIHFFFIDYNQETRYALDSNGLTQSNYLEAATTYFCDNKGIFRKKTDAVYVIVTKSDEIRGDDKASIAQSFLNDNFGSFMNILKKRCKKHSVNFNVKLFSIGDVYFKRICKINREHSIAIIEDLLEQIKPVNDNIFKKFFNS